VYLQIKLVKYNADWEITNIYENLQKVWSQFFTHMLLFVYIWSNLNIYRFIGIWICCQWIQTNSYSVIFDYLQYLVQHLMNDPEGKKNFLPLITVNIEWQPESNSIKRIKMTMTWCKVLRCTKIWRYFLPEGWPDRLQRVRAVSWMATSAPGPQRLATGQKGWETSDWK
jgi:hypothetical protein